MLRTAILIPRPAGTRTTATRWWAWLRQAWAAFTREDDERFLGDACDLADLERRLRRLERGPRERFAPLQR